jgi:hypothetical protein
VLVFLFFDGCSGQGFLGYFCHWVSWCLPLECENAENDVSRSFFFAWLSDGLFTFSSKTL